jgi:hypothetical protein
MSAIRNRTEQGVDHGQIIINNPDDTDLSWIVIESLYLNFDGY